MSFTVALPRFFFISGTDSLQINLNQPPVRASINLIYGLSQLLSSQYDSLLFYCISSVDNIVVPSSKHTTLTPSWFRLSFVLDYRKSYLFDLTCFLVALLLETVYVFIEDSYSGKMCNKVEIHR